MLHSAMWENLLQQVSIPAAVIMSREVKYSWSTPIYLCSVSSNKT